MARVNFKLFFIWIFTKFNLFSYSKIINKTIVDAIEANKTNISGVKNSSEILKAVATVDHKKIASKANLYAFEFDFITYPLS